MLEELNTPRKTYSLREIESISEEFDSNFIADKLRSITKKIETSRQRIGNIKQEKEDYLPWVDFDHPLSDLGEKIGLTITWELFQHQIFKVFIQH